MSKKENQSEQAILAGGCFWCMEAVFRPLRGITKLQPGYIGGHTSSPDYKSVCAGDTGHAEAIQIDFNPEIISYRQLLMVFFSQHDPTTLNRQSADVGTQYRSAIFCTTTQQQADAQSIIHELNTQKIFDRPIVTQIEAVEKNMLFYPAETEHQDYYNRYPMQSYCFTVISPKLAKLRSQFASLLVPDE